MGLLDIASFDRQVALERLGSESFDVLIIGGGITGAGAALDAGARGLKVALVEAADFASGTSSRSSKLVHGGLRYLSQRDFRLVRQALRERQILLHNASHLVHKVPFVIPIYGTGKLADLSVEELYSAALWTYDLSGGIRIGKRHHRIGKKRVLQELPCLSDKDLRGGFLYWDAQADDARLTLEIAKTAAIQYGAAIANYCKIDSLLRDQKGAICGARSESGLEIKAKVILNATGIWSSLTAMMTGDSPGFELRPAKGVHLCVASDNLGLNSAAVFRVPNDDRSIFAIPWMSGDGTRYSYVGTTDSAYNDVLEEPSVNKKDIDYLLSALNHWVGEPITPDHITATWAGLRPLLAGGASARTSDLSRRHKVSVQEDGFVTITGGKLTTYRPMAADAIDQVVGFLNKKFPSCSTKDHPITPSSPSDIPADLSQAIVPGLSYTYGDAKWAVESEMAIGLEDVLFRRTRCGFFDTKATLEAAPKVADVIAGTLGWSELEKAKHLDALRASLQKQGNFE